jgi:hypothetical protein
MNSSVNLAYKVFDTNGHVKIDTALIPQGCKKRLQIFRKKTLIVLNTYPELKYKHHTFRLYNLHHDFIGLEILVVLDSNDKLISSFYSGYIE